MNIKLIKERNKRSKKACQNRKCNCSCESAYRAGWTDMWTKVQPLLKAIEQVQEKG